MALKSKDEIFAAPTLWGARMSLSARAKRLPGHPHSHRSKSGAHSGKAAFRQLGLALGFFLSLEVDARL